MHYVFMFRPAVRAKLQITLPTNNAFSEASVGVYSGMLKCDYHGHGGAIATWLLIC